MTDRFELLEEIGAGGMGSVWKARDTETGDIVALKLVHAHLARDPDYVARFEREVEVARRVDSPHVVKVLGYGTLDGIPFMAMEYVEGQSLRDFLSERGKLTWDEAKPIVRQVAQGLGAAHAAGIIHRDVKPSNILLTADGSAKLADFGIARALDMTRLTGSSTMLGTPHYMAPEGAPSPQADLYGLGCILYEMLAGMPPFEAGTPQELILKHIGEQPQLEVVPGGRARSVVGWLLAKEAAHRPKTAGELVAVLDGSTPLPRGAFAETRGQRRRSPILIAAVAAPLFLAAGAAFGILALSDGESDRNTTVPETTVGTPLPTATRATAGRGGFTATPQTLSTPTESAGQGAGTTAVNPSRTPTTKAPPPATKTTGTGPSPNPTAAPTWTQRPPNTPRPPSATPRPPTATPIPPTATPRPPTATPRPPTATPVPPSYSFSIWLPDGSVYSQGSPVRVCGQISPAGVTVYVTFSMTNSQGGSGSQQVGWSADSGTYCGWVFTNLTGGPGAFFISASAQVNGALVGTSSVSGEVP